MSKKIRYLITFSNSFGNHEEFHDIYDSQKELCQFLRASGFSFRTSMLTDLNEDSLKLKSKSNNRIVEIQELPEYKTSMIFDDEEYIQIDEYARIMKCGKKKIRKLISRKKIKALNVNGSIYVKN